MWVLRLQTFSEDDTILDGEFNIDKLIEEIERNQKNKNLKSTLHIIKCFCF